MPRQPEEAECHKITHRVKILVVGILNRTIPNNVASKISMGCSSAAAAVSGTSGALITERSKCKNFVSAMTCLLYTSPSPRD
eukprot:3099233-Alexandrium_andersonii.AAC.1